MICCFTLIAQGGVFDDRYPSPQASAMSNAFVAVSGDVWSPWYNPAGLARLEGFEVGMAYQRPYNLSFFKNAFISTGLPLGRILPERVGSIGTMALSFESFGVEYQGNTLSSEYTAMFSHGFDLLRDIHSSLSFGYSAKLYFWELGESVEGRALGSELSFGLDLGLQASVYKRTHLGVYVYNINAPTIGSQVAHELPQRIVIGAAYMPYGGLTTSVALNKTVGMDTQLEAGFEFFIIEMLAIRLGASTQPNRFSAGAGINYAGLYFDYSFRNHPVLAETHQFGLIYRFND